MPEHIAQDANSFNGRVSIIGAKTALIYIQDSMGNNVSLTKKPFWTLTPTGAVVANPTKTADLKNGALFIGVKVSFTQPVTMDLEWRASI